jgi:hypothetical protein
MLLLWQQPVILPVAPAATAERYYTPSRQSKYNFYVEDAIELEDALLIWWRLINEE